MASGKKSGGSFLVIFFVFFIMMGLFAIGAYLAQNAQASDAISWPSATGTVDGNYVTEAYEPSEGKHPSWHWYYYPHVAYTYYVDGRAYQGVDIWFYSIRTTDRMWAENAANSYLTGSAVTVYYNPSNPSQAILDKSNLSTFEVVPLLFGAAFITIGAVGIIFVRKRAKRTASAVEAAGPAPYAPASAYDVRPQETWIGDQGAGELPRDEPVLWEGRPERNAFLVIFPEQTILASIFFVVFAAFFLIFGLMAGVIPLMAIAIIFIAIGGGGLSVRIRSAARRHPKVRYVLTNRHLRIEGGQLYNAYLTEDYSRNGFRNLKVSMDAVARSKRDSQVRNLDLRRIMNPRVKVTLGQRMFHVGSIYANNDKLPLIECVKEPEKVLALIQEATWKATREGYDTPIPGPPVP